MIITEKERLGFWERVKISDENFYNGTPCWEWTLCLYRGYGRYNISGRKQLCHRISWTLVNGEILDGLYVLHHCDNPKCVNTEHLFLGTALDNVRDKINKGRDRYASGDDAGARKHPERYKWKENHLFRTNPDKILRGERNGGSKLKTKDIEKIKELYATGEYTQQEIGNIFKISNQHISSILNNKHWKTENKNDKLSTR